MNQQETTVQKSALLLEDIHTWRRRSVRELLRGAAILGLPAVLIGLLLIRVVWLAPIYIGCYAAFVVLARWRRAPYALQIGVILALVYGLGVIALFEDGLSGDGRVFLLALSVIAVLFLGLRQGVYTLVLSGLTLAVFAGMYAGGLLVIPEERVYSADWMAWLSGSAIFMLVGTVLLISQNYALPRLAEVLDQSRRLVQELETHRTTLRQRVEERTATLRRHTEQFRAVADVWRSIAGIHNIDALMEEAVQQILRRFDFYCAAVYLLDESREWAILQAISSEDGNQPSTECEQRLKIGAQDNISHAVATGQPCVVQTADDRGVYPDSPVARPEIALPLRAGGRIIGVLGIQARRQLTFTEEDLSILSVLADQLALAIENARLLTETQQALEQASRYREQETLTTWGQALLRRGGQLAFLYDQIATQPIPADKATALVGGEMQAREVSVHTTPDGRHILVAPIQVHNHSIGSLAFEAGQAWERNKVALVEAAMQQIGQALENARLLEEIQQRATREQLTGQITTRMRETMDVETVLQTAAREMQQALNLVEVEVRMGIGAKPAGVGLDRNPNLDPATSQQRTG